MTTVRQTKPGNGVRRAKSQASVSGKDSNPTQTVRNQKKRGRPFAGEAAVGREAIMDITRQLLRTTPPLEVTRLAVAQAAQVDPNLIRYYFGTVEHLITEIVVDDHRKIHQSMVDLMRTEQSLDWIRARIAHMIDLFIEHPYQHQLIKQVMYKDIDSQEHSEWVTALRTSIEYTKSQLSMAVDQGLLRPVDPRFFHLTLIGIGEIFGTNSQIVTDIFEGTETIETLRDRWVDFIFDLFIQGLRVR